MAIGRWFYLNDIIRSSGPKVPEHFAVRSKQLLCHECGKCLQLVKIGEERLCLLKGLRFGAGGKACLLEATCECGGEFGGGVMCRAECIGAFHEGVSGDVGSLEDALESVVEPRWGGGQSDGAQKSCAWR